jgi:hypothetical protein
MARIASFNVAYNLDTGRSHAVCVMHPDQRAVGMDAYGEGTPIVALDNLDAKIRKDLRSDEPGEGVV